MQKMIIEIAFVNAPLNDRIFFRSLIEFEEFGEALNSFQMLTGRWNNRSMKPDGIQWNN